MTRLRNRRRLRQREAAELVASLEATFGCSVFRPDVPIDVAEADTVEVVLVGNEALALVIGGRPLLTVRGLLAFQPTKRFVTVDMGAVRFVYNGADVMAPGVVDADEDIAPGDFVWIRDERNHQPLAVGEALMAGREMIAGRQGKSVKSLHHVGDDVWKLGES